GEGRRDSTAAILGLSASLTSSGTSPRIGARSTRRGVTILTGSMSRCRRAERAWVAASRARFSAAMEAADLRTGKTGSSTICFFISGNPQKGIGRRGAGFGPDDHFTIAQGAVAHAAAAHVAHGALASGAFGMGRTEMRHDRIIDQ